MYHSITFGEFYTAEEATTAGNPALVRTFKQSSNTWDDWHLIPSSRPTISHPEVVTNYVTVPGLSGSIDLTEYLTSGPVYNDRTGSFDFYVMNGFESWLTIRQKIVEAVHGKRIKMVFEDDPLYYYEGRFTFNE